MVKLKDVYPLYLNNEAQQPNADLEVTDKYTGEIAFRVAQADAATIDAGIQGAIEAAEPMARLPAYQRQAVLQHCVDRFRERFEQRYIENNDGTALRSACEPHHIVHTTR